MEYFSDHQTQVAADAGRNGTFFGQLNTGADASADAELPREQGYLIDFAGEKIQPAKV